MGICSTHGLWRQKSRIEATLKGNLGAVLQSLGKYDKAPEYYVKELALKIEIGDRKGERTVNRNLGTFFQLLNNYDEAQSYHDKALVTVKNNLLWKLGHLVPIAYLFY